MGPRLFRRGNSSARQDNVAGGGLLQWGHAFSDVEIPHAGMLRRLERGDIASMGPRLFRRGNDNHRQH